MQKQPTTPGIWRVLTSFHKGSIWISQNRLPEQGIRFRKLNTSYIHSMRYMHNYSDMALGPQYICLVADSNHIAFQLE